LSTVRPAAWSAMASTAYRNASTSASSGVRSLKTTPGWGKSSTSRRRLCSQDGSRAMAPDVTAPAGVCPASPTGTAGLRLLAGTWRDDASRGGHRGGGPRPPDRPGRPLARREGPAGEDRRHHLLVVTAPLVDPPPDLPVAGLPLLEDGEQGRRDEQRRVGA